MKVRKEPVPPERRRTVRRELVEQLRRGPATARELSAAVGIREREVYQHLEHVRRSLRGSAEALEVTPAACLRCGFVFRDRERLDQPGRCPRCREGALSEPAFRVAPR